MIAIAKHSATSSHWPDKKYLAIFAGEGPRRLALVVEEGGIVRGFLVASAIGREWEIENIAIAGPARRKGLGTRLLGEFLDLARREGAESVFLEVRESNTPARALYEKWAFVEGPKRKAYYRAPEEDAVVCKLDLR